MAGIWLILAAMDRTEQLEMLKKHKLKLSSNADYMQAWVDLAIELTAEIFGNTSDQVKKFTAIKNEMADTFIISWNANRQEKEKRYFLQLSTEIDRAITLAERLLRDSSPMAGRDFQDFQTQIDYENAKISGSITNSKRNWKGKIMQKWFSIDKQAWGILIGAAVALIIGVGAICYTIGHDNGIYKYDKEKNEMDQENKDLQTQLNDKKDSLKIMNVLWANELKTSTRYFKSLPQKQRDSLINLNFKKK
jgi:hypothetical protein